jgi:hypothetical protein
LDVVMAAEVVMAVQVVVMAVEVVDGGGGSGGGVNGGDGDLGRRAEEDSGLEPLERVRLYPLHVLAPPVFVDHLALLVDRHLW